MVQKMYEKIPALLRSIDFSDNRLTDKTLIPFTNKLSHLTYLDLSHDKIDESSKTLREYLIHDMFFFLSTLLLHRDEQ